MSAKVFGIGLSKTGTTSLAKALKILGYDVAMAISGETWPLVRPFDAATHESVATHFEELDRLYPNSLFIYTVRERRAWLRSVRSHWRKARIRKEHLLPDMARRRNEVLGIPGANLDRAFFAAAYDQHHERVMSYFRGRNDFLVMEINEGWARLCPFLGKPIPDTPFPSENVGVHPRQHYRRKIDYFFHFFDQPPRRMIKRSCKITKRGLLR